MTAPVTNARILHRVAEMESKVGAQVAELTAQVAAISERQITQAQAVKAITRRQLVTAKEVKGNTATMAALQKKVNGWHLLSAEEQAALADLTGRRVAKAFLLGYVKSWKGLATGILVLIGYAAAIISAAGALHGH